MLFCSRTSTNLPLSQHSPQTSKLAAVSTTLSFLNVVLEEQGVEKLRRYGPGGYHPTHIGDRHFDGRYEIIHKLGHGSYSTVWLARNRWDARHVMKVFTANISESCSEGNIPRVLNSGSPKLLAYAFVPLLLNEFIITGPSGRHRCIVSDVAGPSLAQWRESDNIWKFPVNVVRSIAAQIIWGLAYIQSRGVIHSGKFTQPFGLTSICYEGAND